jgi:hypothetical protein
MQQRCRVYLVASACHEDKAGHMAGHHTPLRTSHITHTHLLERFRRIRGRPSSRAAWVAVALFPMPAAQVAG